MPSTPEQLAVVANPSENKLVVALPGSGKTHTTVTLADRITNDAGTRVLMVTFTNSAMTEMQHRISQTLPNSQASRVEVKTFAKIMLQQFRQIDPSRRVIMGGELLNYVHRIAKKHNLDFKKLTEFEETIEYLGRSFDKFSSSKDHYCYMYSELLQALQRFKRVDLNTAAKEVVLALEAKTLRPLPHTHFIVDEYQDTDDCQMRWLNAHLQEGKYFCVVGDDDQSIYSWRGAKGYRNMVDFQQAFEAQAYMLSKCFRCSPAILGLAQRLIENNSSRIAKNMASSKPEPGRVSRLVTPPRFKSQFTKKHEGRLETEEVVLPKFMEDAPVETYRHIVDNLADDHKGVAILARTNRHLDCVEYVLGERGIGSVRIGGRSIFDKPNAVGISHLLIAFAYPQLTSFLVEGLSWLGIEESIVEHINHHGVKGDPFNYLATHSSYTIISSLCALRQSCIQDKPSPESVLDELLVVVVKHFNQHQDNFHIIRISAIKTVIGIMSKCKGSFGERAKALKNMLTKGNKKGDHRVDDKVVLCTMTGAKGLEWKRVVLAMLNHDVIPTPAGSGHLDQIEEERRLLYVAMTRAEEDLTLHFNEKKPSRFVHELSLI